jgi:hypothetical protein
MENSNIAMPTEAEWEALRTVFAVRPWGRDKLSRAAAAVLDGRDEKALDAMPALKERLLGAAATIRAANARVS